MYLQFAIILLFCLICDCIDWDDEISEDKSGADETWSPSKESQVNENSDESDEFEDSWDSSSNKEYISALCVRYVYHSKPLAMYTFKCASTFSMC